MDLAVTGMRRSGLDRLVRPTLLETERRLRERGRLTPEWRAFIHEAWRVTRPGRP